MERIVLRHLSGSKANQVEEFPLSQFNELIIGRDPSSTVKYDPDRDDLVGRQHARVTRDTLNPNEFLVTDLGSRNGTFVNKQRIVGTAKVRPGDIVQFGAGGPEFQFDVEPRQEMRTSSAGSPSAVPATRTGSSSVVAPTRSVDPEPRLSSTRGSADSYSTVGKATVERMVSEGRRDSRRTMTMIGAALMVVIAIVAAVLIYQQVASKNRLESDLAAATPMTAEQIVGANIGSVVYIEVSWDLFYTPTGNKLYHQYVNVGQGAQAAYIRFPDGSIEPWLTEEAKTDGIENRPIGGTHTGTGFVVGNEGFILTNRHVAAAWNTTYKFPADAVPGALFRLIGEDDGKSPDCGTKVKGKYKYLAGSVTNLDPLRKWVPGEAKAFGCKPLRGKLLEGKNGLLDVTFAKTEIRYRGNLEIESPRHDVAIVKINPLQSVPKVELNDNYDQIKAGQAVTILGYPGMSPEVGVRAKSQDPFNLAQQFTVVPNPTVSGGLIGKIIRGEQSAANREERDYVSEFGDSIQLTSASTGVGNSGGPVFDDRGRVIGIFYAGTYRQNDAVITFAVPIHYAMEMMRNSRVIN
jgi:serine protease Do